MFRKMAIGLIMPAPIISFSVHTVRDFPLPSQIATPPEDRNAVFVARVNPLLLLRERERFQVAVRQLQRPLLVG